MSKQKSWNRLDNAAKIFPPNATGRDTKVFRFTCRLYEQVDKAVLEYALKQTITDFPLFRSVLKKGMFWYYLEESDLPLIVEEEAIPICSPLYNADKPGLLFRVMYYKNSISLEVFHALADGSGASQFMKTLIYSYLTRKHNIPEHTAGYDAPLAQKHRDDFYRYYEKGSAVVKRDHKRAYNISGEYLPDNAMSAIEAFMQVKDVLSKAHEYNATLSEFMISLLLCAIYEGMAVREQIKPVVISVPVDLRAFFESQTACNFFAVVRISHSFNKDGQSFDAVLNNVRTSLRTQLTRENLNGIIAHYSAIESKILIKAVPLIIKIPALAISGRRAGSEETATFSNVGKIIMPEEVNQYIKHFNVFISTKRPQVSMCSYGETLALSLTSQHEDTGIQRRFIRALTAMGIEMQVVTNMAQFTGEAKDGVPGSETPAQEQTSKCMQCKIDLPDNPERCPLCRNKLTKTPAKSSELAGSGNYYPKIQKKQGTLSRALLLWISFVCICSAAVSATINISISYGRWWSLFVIAGITCFWIDFAITLKKRGNLPSTIIWQVIIISFFAVLWDIITGYRGWSLDFVIPGLCVMAMVAMILLAKLRAPDIQDYVLYLLAVCAFGLVSFILVLTGLVQVVIPSVISFASAVIFLAFLLFFEGHALLSELRRRFHL